MRKEELAKNDWRRKSCMVMYVQFWDNPTPRTFWSKDAEIKDKAGNMAYWYNRLSGLANTTWAGKIKEYVIYRAVNAEIVGDPIIKVVNK